ncbi:MAG: cob(I)yrinic acid a,c-diamide adenosyltransferase [Desulfobacterales bacterium]|nr:cob(I)yrinic acid a,c-diamide adenosyltransferase [Desulfobacterales bacterium]
MYFRYHVYLQEGGIAIYYQQKPYPHERSGDIKSKGMGLIHINYGQGVGKTTRAIGLAVRAAGEGLEVDFVQFLKSGNSAEVKIFEKIPNIHYRCPGKHPFIMSRGPQAVHYEHAAKALSFALDSVKRGAQVLVCDEILDTLLFNLLQKEHLLDLMERCKDKVELVMTGRSAPQEITDSADYVTRLSQVKHPYYTGVRARKGIEY